MSSLMSSIILVHYHWTLLSLQLIKSLIQLYISKLLLNLSLSSSLLVILSFTTETMPCSRSQSFKNITLTNRWNISVRGLSHPITIFKTLLILNCKFFRRISVWVLIWIHTRDNASFWNIELFVHNSWVLQYLVCICCITWCFYLLLSTNDCRINLSLTQSQICWVALVLMLVKWIHITSSAVYNAWLRNSTITINSTLAKWMRLLLVVIHLVICVLGSCGNISSKFSLTRVWNEIFPLLMTILRLCIHLISNSYGTSKEACGFVHNQLMSAISNSIDSSRYWILSLVNTLVLLRNLSLKLTLWELLTHFCEMMGAMWIWVSYWIPSRCLIVYTRAWGPHLDILFVKLRIILS